MSNHLIIGLGATGKINQFESSDYDKGSEFDVNGKPIHSRRFFSFGSLNAVYPNKEIQEWATYSYAQQAIKQILFNRWIDGKGFQECGDDEIGFGFTDEIQHPETQSGFMLDYSHLTLEKPIIERSENTHWTDFQTTWKNQLDHELESVKAEEKKNWILAIDQRSKAYFENGFRNQGVKDFFSSQSKEIKSYAIAIRDHIGSKLFDDLKKCRKSLVEIEKYLVLLTNNIQFRIEQSCRKIDQLQNEELPKLEKEAEDKRQEFYQIKWIRELVTKAAEKTLEQYKEILCDYYHKTTLVESLSFARLLMTEIAHLIENLHENIQAVKEKFGEMNHELGSMAASSHKALNAFETNRLKRCDFDKVEAVVMRCIADHESQWRNAEKARELFMASLINDGYPSFGSLGFDYNSLLNSIIENSQSNVIADLERVAEATPTERIIGREI